MIRKSWNKYEVSMIAETTRLLRENIQKVIVGKDEPILLTLVSVVLLRL